MTDVQLIFWFIHLCEPNTIDRTIKMYLRMSVSVTGSTLGCSSTWLRVGG